MNFNLKLMATAIHFNWSDAMTLGKLLASIGFILFVTGLVMHYAPWLVNWFGKLPGDIRIDGENKQVFIPLTSMFIISIVLTVIINLFFRK